MILCNLLAMVDSYWLLGDDSMWQTIPLSITTNLPIILTIILYL